MEIFRKLHPFKMKYSTFCRVYLELLKTENRFYEEIQIEEFSDSKLAKNILNYVLNKPQLREINFGNKMIFSSQKIKKNLDLKIS